MEIIEELEPSRRGIYAGGFGYFGADGGMDTCIGLRTALVKDGVMHVQAGGGVVADSDPRAEHEETKQKARALFRAAEAELLAQFTEETGELTASLKVKRNVVVEKFAGDIEAIYQR